MKSSPHSGDDTILIATHNSVKHRPFVKVTYAASAFDRKTRFGQVPKEDARHLLILWPFAPVATVYDTQGTEGKECPEDAANFFTTGTITAEQIASFKILLTHKKTGWSRGDAGDVKTGKIKGVKRGDRDTKAPDYEIRINRNHDTAPPFVTLTHELAHLFLGSASKTPIRQGPFP